MIKELRRYDSMKLVNHQIFAKRSQMILITFSSEFMLWDELFYIHFSASQLYCEYIPV